MNLPRTEWDFNKVPDTEIIACCLWEYARESSTIAMAADIYWCNVRHIKYRELYKQYPEKKTEHDEKAALLERRAKVHGFDYGHFREQFWSSDLSSVGIYESLVEQARDDVASWRKQRRAFRSHMVTQVSKSYTVHPMSPAFVGDLEELWNANRKELDEIRSQTRPANDDSEDAALWIESSPLSLESGKDDHPSGKLTAAFTLDFAHFTDREMQEELRQWLSENRPQEWKRALRVFPDAKQRGRKLIEYRVAVERLGLMRLLHRHSPSELRRKVPVAWARYGRKKADFRREVREASKFFRRLFPFLPKDERPNSEQRFGVWYPEMTKICDKVEREMGMTTRA